MLGIYAVAAPCSRSSYMKGSTVTKRVIVLALIASVALAVVGCGGGADTGSPGGSGSDGGTTVTPGGSGGGAPVADGAALLEERCTVCHSTSRILGASKDRAGWVSTIERMVGRGAKLTTEEQAVLADYLAGL